LIWRDEILVVPGAADAVTARIVESTGFPAVYVTGAGFANASYGIPDVGLVSVDSTVEHVRRICDVVGIPVIADADTGYGGVLNVARTVRQLERAGAAAIQIEDQTFPKRCGHFEGKTAISVSEMKAKISAAVDSRDDAKLVLIARTDALATEGLDAAVERGQEYAESGADVIFVEAPTTYDELSVLPAKFDVPLLVNIVEGGKTPNLSAAELQQMGFAIALFANSALRVAIDAVTRALAELYVSGTTAHIIDRMASFEDRQGLVGLPVFQALEDRYLGNQR
jgi:2-methylisocitrate lyase-like PEP mutase family enzyme